MSSSARRYSSTAAQRTQFTHLDEWLNWQETLHFTQIELGLERCQLVAEALDVLSPAPYVISIAGTNGKGSSAMMLASILKQAGYLVGIYTSPHLIHYQERIRINGEMVSAELLCDTFAEIDAKRGSTSLTYFEFGTLAALKIFSEAKLDVAILEVGMGGRLDAVNVVDANIALISGIDLDHELWLGSDRESIGREKAGIFRSDALAVCADPSPPASVIEHARKLGTTLYCYHTNFHITETTDSWQWHTKDTSIAALAKTDYINYAQLNNAAGVLMVLHLSQQQLPVSTAVIKDSLQHFHMPGRFQCIMYNEIQIVLDVAHNPQAGQLLAAKLQAQSVGGQTYILLGMLQDKQHSNFIKTLLPIATHWTICALNSPRAQTTKPLGAIIYDMQPTSIIDYQRSVADGLQQRLADASAGDRIVVTGSFITVGAALHYLTKADINTLEWRDH